MKNSSCDAGMHVGGNSYSGAFRRNCSAVEEECLWAVPGFLLMKGNSSYISEECMHCM